MRVGVAPSVKHHMRWALSEVSEVTSMVSRALDCTSTNPCDRRLCHLDTVDGDHPWSLMGGLILVVVSLCRRAGRKCFEGRVG